MCSLLDYLGGKLEAYVALLPKVQLVRTTKREGLVRARMLGEFLQFEVFLSTMQLHSSINSIRLNLQLTE